MEYLKKPQHPRFNRRDMLQAGAIDRTMCITPNRLRV